MDENNQVGETKEVTKDEEKENFGKEMDLILEGIPKESRHEVKKLVGMSMQMGGVISPQMELMKKMTSEHVSEFLATQKKEMENHYKENRENKIFLFAILLITLVFIILLIQLLKDKPDIMEKVLFTLGGLITGLFGGYGIGKSKNSD